MISLTFLRKIKIKLKDITLRFENITQDISQEQTSTNIFIKKLQ